MERKQFGGGLILTVNRRTVVVCEAKPGGPHTFRICLERVEPGQVKVRFDDPDQVVSFTRTVKGNLAETSALTLNRAVGEAILVELPERATPYCLRVFLGDSSPIKGVRAKLRLQGDQSVRFTRAEVLEREAEA